METIKVVITGQSPSLTKPDLNWIRKIFFPTQYKRMNNGLVIRRPLAVPWITYANQRIPSQTYDLGITLAYMNGLGHHHFSLIVFEYLQETKSCQCLFMHGYAKSVFRICNQGN